MIRTDEEDKFVTLVENPWSSTVRGDQAGWEHIAQQLGPQRLASREPMTNTEQHTETHTQPGSAPVRRTDCGAIRSFPGHSERTSRARLPATVHGQ